MSLDLSRPLVYLITSGQCDAPTFADGSTRVIKLVKAAVDAGVDLIQIREKKLSGKLLFELTQRAADITRGVPTRLLVNDRLDVAIAAGADGVHLTSTSIPARAVRKYAPSDFCIGASVHGASEAEYARTQGCDFVLYGPVFASPGKGSGVGVDAVENVVSSVGHFSVIAVGGIDEGNARQVVEAGAAGVAAIRSLNSEDGIRHVVSAVRP